MNTVIILPHKLSGTIKAPPSKSDSHRAIICAALSRGVSNIEPIYLSDDIKATINAISSLGAISEFIGDRIIIDGQKTFSNKNIAINCLESASTLRFLIPVAAAGGINTAFYGTGNLPSRPIGPYLDCLPKFGVNCRSHHGIPLEISGKLKPGYFKIPGNISSQFISGLLLSLPLLKDNSIIKLTTHLESSAYIDMTINTMKEFGVNVEKSNSKYIIPGNQSYNPCNYYIEGDYSQAAFFIAAGSIGKPIKITGLRKDSVQGDIQAIEIFKEFGASIKWESNDLVITPKKLNGIKIDVSQVPDLVPILAVTACFANGTTEVVNASRLRIKECDRLKAISDSLNSLGANIIEKHDGLIIKGINKFKSGTVDSFNDHRIVMALSIAAMMADGNIKITNAQSINKSYPSFFKDYNMLGGNANVISMG